MDITIWATKFGAEKASSKVKVPLDADYDDVKGKLKESKLFGSESVGNDKISLYYKNSGMEEPFTELNPKEKVSKEITEIFVKVEANVNQPQTPVELHDDFEKELADSISKIWLENAPSTFGMNWNTSQSKLKYNCHRPAHFCGSHVSLFSNIFNSFEMELESLSFEEGTLSQEDCDFVLEVCKQMSAEYPSEKDRMNAFNKLLSEYLKYEVSPGNISRPNKGDVTTDGSLEVQIGESVKALVLSVEVKPELGKGNCCAYMEGLHYKGIFAAREAMNNIVKKGCIPSFLLLLVGPFFQVHGTIYLQRLHSDPLTPLLPLFILRHDRKMMGNLTACFRALKNAVQSQMQSYDIETKFPAFTNEGILKYKKQLFPKQLWEATGVDGEYIVKFTEMYGVAAHTMCYKLNIAPDFQMKTYGRFKVIIMKKIDGMSLSEKFLSTLNVDQRTQVFQLVTDAINSMHQNGYVHGDLRGPNIMMDQSLTRVWFVDFDFAGKEKQAVYPPFLNKKDIDWHEGVSAGKKIERDHDLFWVNKCRKYFNM